MKKTLLLLFFLFFNILTYSACGRSRPPAETGDFGTSKSKLQKEPKLMYGMIMESNEPGIQRPFPGLHAVQHTRIERKAKAVYGGSGGGAGANAIRRPRNSGRKNSASSYSIKSSSLFMAALRHLIFGLLLGACFF